MRTAIPQNKGTFFIKNLPIILAFVIPMLALAVLFVFREIFPFGEQMYMRSDCYHQYVTFLKEFQSILKNGDSLLYTWNIGLGSDFPSTYAYYLATPVYWLVGLIPTGYVTEFLQAWIIIKAGVMSGTFAIYMEKHTGQRSYITALFGIFYAMSSYMAAYSWNVMWLDNLLLLPLICLGLERLVKENKVALYTITLALAVISNYYIAIMIAIFLILYFLYLVICEPGEKGFKHKLKSLGRFSLYSVVGGLMGAATFFPAFINLMSTASSGGTFPTKLKAYFNFLEMISHAVMNVEATILKGYIPNIYCTIALFMLIPLYMLCKKIRLQEKIGKALLMAIFLATFSLNIPTYIWHGFHYPNSLSSRESFIYIFLVLTMACEALLQLKEFLYKEIIACFVASVVAVYALQVLFASEKYTVLLVTISALFLALYFIWIMLYKYGKIPKVIMVIALIAIIVSEACINTNETGYSTISRTNYVSDNESIQGLLDEIDDDDFYRVEKISRRTKNDGAWLNYRSASVFSSTTIKGITKFYNAFGMQSQTNSCSYYGHTPLAGALLSVKYEISKTELNDCLKILVGQSEGMYLYKNEYTLPLGFMVDIATQANTKLDTSNPFNSQNSFVEAATGISDLYVTTTGSSGKEPTTRATLDGRGFIYITESLESAQVMITRDGIEVLNQEFKNLAHTQLIDVGDVKAGDVIIVKSTDDSKETITIIPAFMSYEKYYQVFDALSTNGLEISSFDDTNISATISVDEDGLLFTSIPYSEGWDVYVDGVKINTRSFYDAFISFELKAGDHTIEFKYHSPGFGASIAVSVTALFIFVILMLYRRNKYTAVASAF